MLESLTQVSYKKHLLTLKLESNDSVYNLFSIIYLLSLNQELLAAISTGQYYVININPNLISSSLR